MARHIVVSFEEDDKAAMFVEALKVTGKLFLQGEDGHFTHVDHDKVSVLGIFAKPTKFCDCVSKEEKKTARSQKYGWYIHWPGCGKPIPGHIQSAMKNLLEPTDIDSRKRRATLIVREGETVWPEPSSTKEVK